MLIYMEMSSILKCFRRLDLSTFFSLSDILITPSVSLYQASETRYVKIDGSSYNIVCSDGSRIWFLKFYVTSFPILPRETFYFVLKKKN